MEKLQLRAARLD